MGYPKLHLLGLPVEIRMTIWRHIYTDILLDGSIKYNQPPVTPWAGLVLTSRVIRDEVSQFWPRTMVPFHSDDASARTYNRITALSSGLMKTMFKDFRRLSVQLPIQKNAGAARFYHLFASGLLELARVILDLRIFFVGDDAFGTTTNFMGCGIRCYNDKSQHFLDALPKDGLSFLERGAIFRALTNLHRLRNLVLSNSNFPLLQSHVGNKAHLKSLSLLSDSRAPLYKHLGGSLIEWCPPRDLRVFEIGANTVLGASAMIWKVLHTLRDLTLIIPAESWQRVRWKWLEEAAMVVQQISFRGRNLRRFRLCIEQPLQDATTGHLIDALKQHLPNTNLETLEIHATLESAYFGRELIEALPKTLKRLYISQELVLPEVLLAAVNERYFGAKDDHGHEQAGYLGLVGYEFWDRESTRLALLRMNGALLDRERNAHLFDEFEHSKIRFGGNDTFQFTSDRSYREENEMSVEVGHLEADSMITEDIPKGALIYYRNQNTKRITKAEMVFYGEEVARAEDRIPLLVMPDIVDVKEHDHWMTE